MKDHKQSEPPRDQMQSNSMAKAIRKKCLDCSGDSHVEVRLCGNADCPLWRFRFGKKPSTVAKDHPELLEIECVQRLAKERSG
jgi:hypothetical protein